MPETDNNSESLLLTGMILDTEFLKRVASIPVLKYLNTKYAKTLSIWILEYWKEYACAPKSSITEIVQNKIRKLDPTLSALIIRLLESISERYGDNEDPFDFNYAITETEKYLQSRALILRREEEERLLNDNKVYEAYQLVSQFTLPSITDNIGKRSLIETLPSLALTFGELEELDLPGKEFILQGDLPLEKGSITMVAGKQGSGKTWFTTELARIISTAGIGLAGTCRAREVTKTLIVDGELPLHEIRERSKILELEDIRHLTVISKLLLDRNDVVPSLNITDQSVRDIITDYLVKNDFGLVILDNLYSLTGGLDLNSAEEWEPINSWFLKLRSKDISVIISHHLSKDGSVFGSISKQFNINNCLIIKRQLPKDHDEDCCCFGVAIEKQRGTGINLPGKKFVFRNNIWSVEGFSNKSQTGTKPSIMSQKKEESETEQKPSLRSSLRR